MKHQIPDWVMVLINLLPILIIVGVFVYFLYVMFKKGRGEKVPKSEAQPEKNRISDHCVPGSVG